MSSADEPILRVEGLTKYYESGGSFVDNLLGRTQLVKAVDDVDLELYPGETVGVVGESGCGKTTLGRAILQLIEPTDGKVHYRPTTASETIAADDEITLTDLSSSRLRSLRTDLQYIFQDPFSSLNPRLTVGDIIAEPLEIHGLPASDPQVETNAELRTDGVDARHVTVSVADDIDKVLGPVEDGRITVFVTVRRDPVPGETPAPARRNEDRAGEVVAEADEDIGVSIEKTDDGYHVTLAIERSESQVRSKRVQKLLEIVGLNASHAYRYPHEFSGGQRQRIGIARALAVDPEVIVCDEPVSALDVSVQAQILNLLKDLQEEFDLSYLFIAHDLSVVEHISDRVAVMYLGEVAEAGSTDEVFSSPKHPYTEALLSVVPEPDPLWQGEKILLEGEVPSPLNPPSGCRFHTRCHCVIQPESFDIDQSAWRSVFDLKLAVQGADSLEDVIASTAGGEPMLAEGEDIDIESREIRDTYDIPATLSDARADGNLVEALDAICRDDLDAALDIFADAFVSPCEQIRPDRVQDTSTHEIACLLYDDDYPDRIGVPDTDGTSDDATTDD